MNISNLEFTVLFLSLVAFAVAFAIGWGLAAVWSGALWQWIKSERERSITLAWLDVQQDYEWKNYKQQIERKVFLWWKPTCSAWGWRDSIGTRSTWPWAAWQSFYDLVNYGNGWSETLLAMPEDCKPSPKTITVTLPIGAGKAGQCGLNAAKQAGVSECIHRARWKLSVVSCMIEKDTYTDWHRVSELLEQAEGVICESIRLANAKRLQ